ncbi:MAG TPA: rhomboid family intramembrane serine protease [Candidatus Norongarragalinales archaeon]|nr:rhomboid family intramembrane serine protease [Candidatus Norongarragalinales archaeon]
MYSTLMLVLLVAVFVLQTAISGFTELFWFNPAAVATQPWGFFTSMFLHGGLAHLFFNGFALLMFGPFLEQRIGSRKFLELFLAAGIAGSVFYFLFVLAGITPALPALGASGAIYGILGALAVLAPNLVVFVMFVPMPMRYAAILWVAIEFLGTFNPASGIANAAHLGGLFLGFVYAYYFFKNKEF